MDPSSPTYYDLLGISPTAELPEIRRAFRQLARRYHPDVNPGDRTALERFQQLSHAYHVLSDPITRSQYDASLHGSIISNLGKSSSHTAAEWYQQGLQLAQQEHYQAAIDAYTNAIGLNPQFLDAHNQRGFSHYKLGQTVEAFADYANALALNDQQATSYYYRGLARLKLGYNQGAIADFSQAIALEPTHGQAYYHRGSSHLEQNERRLAQQDFIQAEQIFLQQHHTALAQDARIAYRQLGGVAALGIALRQHLGALPRDLVMVLFRVISQPQQSMATCCDRLPAPRANLVTLALLMGFGLGLSHTVNSRWSNLGGIAVIGNRTGGRGPSLMTLMGISLTPFMVLMLGSILIQVIAKQRVKWQASCFLAGITLFPLYGLIAAWRGVPMPLFGLISLICGGYLLLLLYGGYRYGLQCNHAIAIMSAVCLTGIITLPLVLLTV